MALSARLHCDNSRVCVILQWSEGWHRALLLLCLPIPAWSRGYATTGQLPCYGEEKFISVKRDLENCLCYYYFFFLLPLVIRTKFDEEPGFQLKWGESRNCFLFVFILIYDDGKVLSCLEDGQHPQASVILLVLKYSKSSYWPCQNCSRIFVYVQCKWLLFQNGVFCGKHQLATQLLYCKEKKKSLFFYSSVC